MNQLGYDEALGDQVDHAEKFGADERLGEEGGEGSDPVDDDHGHVEESGFDCGGAAGDDSGIGGGESVVSLVFEDADSQGRMPAGLEIGEVGVSGCGDYKLGGMLRMDARARFADYRQVLGQFGVPATGKDGDDRLAWIEILLAAEFVASLGGLHGAD